MVVREVGGSREEYVGLKESEEVRLPFADRFGLGPTYHLYACLSYCLCCGVLTFL